MSSSSGSRCAVCHWPDACTFFGVKCCRPCASFFRRSVAERKQYHCWKSQNNCPIENKGMRNSCRACRLRRCFAAGLRTEHAEFYIAQGEASTISTSQLEQQQAVEQTFSPIASTPLANQMANAMREFDDGEKAICAQQCGLGAVLGNKMHLTTHEEHMQMERGCVMLLLALVRQHFAPIDTLPLQTKLNILKDYTLKFRCLRIFEMTVNAFPDNEQFECVLLHPGCLMDKNRQDHFYGSMDEEARAQQIAICMPFMDKFLYFIAKQYKPLAITPSELAALQAIQLWNCVHQFCASDPIAQRQRDALFVELHTICATHPSCNDSGGQNGAVAIRFGRLLTMLAELTSLNRETVEMFTLFKVFTDSKVNPDITDLLDEMLAGEGQ